MQTVFSKTCSFLTLVSSFLGACQIAPGANLLSSPAWADQFGGARKRNTQLTAISAGRNGTVVAVGNNDNSADALPEDRPAGFARLYNAAGELVWTRSDSIPDLREGYSAAAMDIDSYAVIGGNTLSGDPPNYAHDALLRKVAPSGELIWTRVLTGATTSAVNSLDTDESGNIYVGGVASGPLAGTFLGMFDAFVMKLDRDGNTLWAQQFGTTGFEFNSQVAVARQGQVYLAGFTDGVMGEASLGSEDGYLSRFSSSGTLEWTRQLGTAGSDSIFGLAVDDAGNAYLGGSTDGRFPGEPTDDAAPYPQDGFVMKVSPQGELLWQSRLHGFNDPQQRGRSDYDIALDPSGRIYVAGSRAYTDDEGYEEYDGFVNCFSTDGQLLAHDRLGSTGALDFIAAVSVDQPGTLYLAGATQGSLFRENMHETEAWIAKYALVPEPHGAGLAGCACLALGALCYRSTRRHGLPRQRFVKSAAP